MVGWPVHPSGSRRQSSLGNANRGESLSTVPPSTEMGNRLPDSTSRRVLTNNIPGVIIFLGTITLMFLSIIILIFLVSQGLFNRLIVSVNAQTEGFYWAPYGEECVLDKNGFIPNTCSTDVTYVTPAAAFSAIGTVLAQQWSAEMKEAGGRLRVTTCIIGGTSAVGWANLQFIAGYDEYPSCLPTSPQTIAGMAMLETTIRENHVDGLYFLTLYSDLDPAMTVIVNENTDGTTQNIISNPKRTLITAEGEIEGDDLGQNYIIYSKPLGPRYLVTGLCVTIIEELSQVIKDQQLTGWSQGKHSMDPIVTGWSCGHHVSNAGELVVLQIVFGILTIFLFSGDLYVTFEGFKGIVIGESIMTYTVISGLERRKALLLCIVLNCFPGLLYLDVSRIYYFTDNGYKIWFISSIMMSTLFSFGFLFLLSLIDTIPFRIYRKCIGYSAPLFLFTSILSITWSSYSSYQYAYNKFYSADPYLGLWIRNGTWPSGSYVATGTPVVLTYLVDDIFYPILGSFIWSIFYATCHRYIFYRRILVDTTWCHGNSFLSHIKVPNFITSLPLGPCHAIRLGNEMYCKPSTLAVMGYATVQDKSIQNNKSHIPCSVVSIYGLILSMILPGWCETIGIMEKNTFKPSPSTCTLDTDKKYIHTRGVSVV